MKVDIYQKVTNQIIEAIENEVEGNFELPWHNVSALPQNVKTVKFYNGINVPLLWAQQIKNNFISAQWGTYKQWEEIGAQVKKGEKGSPVVFWKVIEQENENDEEDQTRMFARWSNVFNADQVENYVLKAEIKPTESAEVIITSSGADVRYGSTQAFYNAKEDYIALPSPEYFKKTCDSSATENFYSTLFHELTHWTGAPMRLDRKKKGSFGDKDYAYEELVAELGAAMLCAKTGVVSTARKDHAQYIANWLKALKNDKRFIFSASSQAQKAADYLFSLQEITKEEGA